MSTPIASSVSLEIRDFRLVEAVLRLGSLGKAAKELHRTPSALSHQLRLLERRARTQLFIRVAKRLTPTAAAEQLLERARVVLAQVRQAEEEISGDGAAATIRLSTECYSSYVWLPRVLRLFRVKHPAIGIRLNVAGTRRPVAALLADRLDVALVCSGVEDRRIACYPVFADELVAVIPPDHRWTTRSFVNARDLADENLVLAPAPKSQVGLVSKLLAAEHLEPRSVTRIPMTEAILEMTREGLGVGIMPRWAARTYLSAGMLRAVRITRAGLRRDWWAAIRQAPAPPRHLKDLVEILARSTF